MADFRGVVLDWRGTLVLTLSEAQWAGHALELLGRSASERDAETVAQAIRSSPDYHLLDSDIIDTDAGRHREIYHQVLASAGLDEDLVHALYTVESDSSHNPFAADAAVMLGEVRAMGIRIVVLSDIHFDIRPAFAAAGLDSLVSHWVLSFEHGVQKPDPRIFAIALDALVTRPEQVLMVGDRGGYDGAATQVGMPTLLLPPLTSTAHCRLHLVTKMLS